MTTKETQELTPTEPLYQNGHFPAVPKKRQLSLLICLARPGFDP